MKLFISFIASIMAFPSLSMLHRGAAIERTCAALSRDDLSYLTSSQISSDEINQLLYEACKYDAPKCVEFLIKARGANVNYADGMHNTSCLLEALCYKQYQIAEILVAYQADMNQYIGRRVFSSLPASERYPRTALSEFCVWTQNGQPRVEWLLAHGADPNRAQQGIEITPLWIVCQREERCTSIEDAQKKITIAKALLDAGAQTNITAGYYQTTPLQEAQKDLNPMLARFLIKYLKKVKIE